MRRRFSAVLLQSNIGAFCLRMRENRFMRLQMISNIFIENIALYNWCYIWLYIINILCMVGMNSNGVGTNGTRSPVRGANPEAAKCVYININTHIHRMRVWKAASLQ
jgi:hypothetical protein